MPMMAVVRLRYSSKDYWFDPAGADIHEGDHVLVKTERGRDLGLVVAEPVDMDEALVPDSLKPIERVATEDDFAHAEELDRKSAEAMKAFHELADKHKLDLKPTAVHFLFDETRATFYFTADARVDFRALVRDLATRFHTRVDMRQVGVRDEARMIGGLGHCGEELCCARLGVDLQGVSIRMAKEQDLSLNPAKISGLCGRLMCCLHYEYDAYKDFKQRAPKKNAVIETPAGTGKVVEFDMPRERLTLRMEDGSRLVVPLDAMDTGGKQGKDGERVRPCHIGQEAFDRINEELRRDKTLAMMGGKLFSDNPELADREAKGGSIERNEGAGTSRRKRSRSKSGGSQGGRGRGGRGGSGSGSGSGGGNGGNASRDTRKRRRSVSAATGEELHRDESGTQGGKEDGGQQRKQGSGKGRKRRRGKRGGGGSGSGSGAGAQQGGQKQDASRKQGGVRPGQHSSTIGGDAKPDASQGAGGGGNGNGGGRRRRRRRRGGSGGGASGGGE